MSATARVGRMRCQVKDGTGSWATIRGIRSLDFAPVTAEFADSSGFENNGYSSQEVVSGSWGATIGIWRRILTGGLYPAEQEYIRLQSFAMFGEASRLEYRFFDSNGGPEAFTGFAFTAYKQDSGDWKGLQSATVTLMGDGALSIITNPASGALVPVVRLVTPTGAAVGDLVTIYGENFTGTTGVTIDGATVVKFRVQSDNQITALVPATVSGAANVIVTNAAGASTAYAYTAA